MTNGRSVIGVICARGGSKGVPRKNVRPLGGRPLVAWTIEAAQRARSLDRVILSSDDEEIIATAKSWRCEVPFVRPAELARDDSPIEDALIHAIDTLDRRYDYLVLLQASSPFRSAEDIEGCVRRCVEAGAPSCLTVTAAAKSPYLALALDPANRLSPLFRETYGSGHGRRRQDLPAAYMPNGAVFVADIATFRATRDFYGPGALGYPMPADRSIDIDNEMDFLFAEALLARQDSPRFA
jgi:N-acylneuraminate cytidylyltransferase